MQCSKSKKWEVDVEAVRHYLVSFSKALENPEKGICSTIEIGHGWGVHHLCNTVPDNCTFYSFGISEDYSFDIHLAENYSCQGFAADPTITHPSKLHSNITFHQIGAKMLRAEQDQKWFSTSIPSLMKWRRDERIDVLKMDCEGCEYSIAKDVCLESPQFFESVGQFAVEIHMSKVWLNSSEYIFSLGKLFQALDEAKLKLAHSSIRGCAPADEEAGCLDILDDVGIPCGKGKSCHNYLFARSMREA